MDRNATDSSAGSHSIVSVAKRFIGISLGGARGKTTAVARLEFDEELDQLVLAEARFRLGQRGGGWIDSNDSMPGVVFRDEVLLNYLRQWPADCSLLAIDAPLTLPPCIRCTLPCPGIPECEVPVVKWMHKHAVSLGKGATTAAVSRPRFGTNSITPYTQRATDLLLAQTHLHPRETLGQGMGPITARATYLRRALVPDYRLFHNLIEVHPRATLIRIFGSTIENESRVGPLESMWECRKKMLLEMTQAVTLAGVWPELVIRNLHVFYAVVSAFSAYRCWTENWKGPHDLLDSQATPQFRAAIADLRALWLEDGWIWVPP